MNLEKVENHVLLRNIEGLVKTEKEFTVKVVKFLAEIDKRKLFVELGYNSLYAYCRDHLNYSEQESTIRVNAVRLIKTNKVAERKLEKQELSLTVAADLFAHFKKYNDVNEVKLTVEAKNSLIEEVSKQSSRQAKKIIQQKLNLEPVVKCEMKLKEATVERLNKLKEKLDIQDIDLLLNFLMQEKEDSLIREKVTLAQMSDESKESRYIPVKLKRKLFGLANYRCEFVNRDGSRCSSRVNLQVEHIKPYSLGGGNGQSNLKVLCFTHNQYSGIKLLGRKRMNGYA